MLQVTLGEKTYTVEYVSALALREIEKPMKILGAADKPRPVTSSVSASADTFPSRGRQDGESPGLIGADLDALVNWFCLMFGRQFTAEEVYEYYPADRLITDIALCVLAVQQRVSGALKAFPTIPAADRKTEA